MPVIIVYGMPEKSQGFFEQIITDVQNLVSGISGLKLKQSQVSVFFPKDHCSSGLGEEIIIKVENLIKKPERTWGVIKKLRIELGRYFFGKFPIALIEVTVNPIKAGDCSVWLPVDTQKTEPVESIEHAIDCDADPFIPNGSTVEEHQKGGMIKFDASKVELYLSKKQKNGSIEGNKLREELKGKKVMNANVLDYLLANPKVIPDEWKGRAIFFWGTIYRSSGGDLYVRCLYWVDGQWHWSDYWLGADWSADDPAVVLAS